MIFNTLTYYLLFLLPTAIVFRRVRADWRPIVCIVGGSAFFLYFSITQFGGYFGAACLLMFFWESIFSRLYSKGSIFCWIGIAQAVLFLGGFLELTQSQGAGWSDLVGNRAMGYSTEPAVAAALYEPDSILAQWRFRLIGPVPMLRDHSQLWKYVELFRRELSEIGMPKAEVNRFGRIEDFKMVALPDQPQFDRDCESAVKNSAPLLPAVQALLKLARERNTQVIVVEMPMNSAHREHCYATAAWQQYRAHLQQQLQAGGAAYVVASDWVPDDTDFGDGLHLTDAGARVFSTRIAQWLAARLDSN